jgi:hypothetical protein
MSFGGHVQDMLNRIKQNASLKNGRCNKFKGGNNYSKTQSIKTGYDFPKLAKNELDEFKQELKREAQKRLLKKQRPS